MKVIRKAREMNEISFKMKKAGKDIGFVPTMGALHDGHLSLVKKSKKENDVTVVSIFVNPTQFGPNEDLSRYPRTFEADKKLLEGVKTDYLFYPDPEEMYPKGYQTFIDLEKLPQHLCGLKREGHFRGVATVVTKLFNIVMPDKAYFGQKDYQQAAIIRRMAKDLNLQVKIQVMPIVREKDGLAMSSRNRYLGEKERKDATVLYRSLKLAAEMAGKKTVLAGEIISEMRKMIAAEAPYARIDYVSIVDPDTLEDVPEIRGSAVAALAVFFGDTRLIDNMELKIPRKR